MRMLRGAGRRVEQRLARAQPVLVLGMDGGAPAAARQHPAQGRIVGNQQRAGGTAHEDLDAGAARQPLQPTQFLCIGIRRAEEEGVIAPGAPFGAAQLVGQRLGRIRIGRRVRHLEDRRDAALGGAARAGLQVFLVLQPRLAEMDLGVDDAGQDVQAGSVETLGCGGPAEVAQCCNTAVPHADIGRDAAHRRQRRAAGNHQIEGIVVHTVARRRSRPFRFIYRAGAALKDFPAHLDNRCPKPERARRK